MGSDDPDYGGQQQYGDQTYGDPAQYGDQSTADPAQSDPAQDPPAAEDEDVTITSEYFQLEEPLELTVDDLQSDGWEPESDGTDAIA